MKDRETINDSKTTNTQVIICPYCNKENKNKHFEDENETVFCCSYCGKEFYAMVEYEPMYSTFKFKEGACAKCGKICEELYCQNSFSVANLEYESLCSECADKEIAIYQDKVKSWVISQNIKHQENI